MALESPRLPSELWQLTIDNFNKSTSLRDLKALCLTSEEFRSIAQPRLFEALHLSALPLPNGEPRRAEGILQLFTSRPESRSWTSNLIVYGTDGDVLSGGPSTADGETEGTPHQGAIIHSVFLQMQGLKSIELLHYNLTSEMYRHLYDLQRLRDVSLWGLRATETAEKEVAIGGVLSFIKLRIQHSPKEDDGPAVMRVYRALLCPTLRSLTLDPRIADAIFRHIAFEHTVALPSLLHFNVSPSPQMPPDLRSLFAFLRSCPNLSRFVLPANGIPLQSWPSNHEGGYAHYEDAAGCAPELSSIHASGGLVRLLLPGRPINDIEAFFPRELPLSLSEPGLEPYRCGKVSLKKFSVGAVTWTSDSMETLARLFPSLELLSVRVVGGSLSVSASGSWKMRTGQVLRTLMTGLV